MDTAVTIRFGDPTGLTGHRDLSHPTLPVNGVNSNGDGDPSHVTVAGHRLAGAVLAADRDQVVVYGGPVIPAYLQSFRVERTGWRWAGESTGLPVVSPVRPLTVLLVDVTDEVHPRWWTRVIWTTEMPRPMQRLDVALAPGRVMVVRALLPVAVDSEGGHSHGALIASSTDAGDESAMRAAGWTGGADDEGVNERVWWPLHQLSEAMQTQTATVVGRSVVTGVTVTGRRVDPVVAQRLPRDVLDALMHALDDAA